MSTTAPGTACSLLYCHCAYAKVVPPAVKDEVLARLTESGVPFEAVPDLCRMSAQQDPKLKALAEGDGPLAIAACYPRAVRWLFAAAGAPLRDEGVTIANMRTESAEAVVQAVLPSQTAEARSSASAPPATEQPIERARPEPAAARAAALTEELNAPAPGGWKPWFPVIDYSRCTNCMQCLSFCLFEVYGVDDGKIQVQNQSNCKTDCPACSRVCPEVAIMFPKYRHGPINGDEVSTDDVRREAMKVDISALLGGDVYAVLRDRSAKAKSRFSKERDEDRALTERQNCLIKLKQMKLDIPAEVLAALPSPDQIRAKAEAAAARAQEALASAAQRDAREPHEPREPRPTDA